MSFKRPIDAPYGCSDSGCVFGNPGGMCTNGGCKCLYFNKSDIEARHRAMRGVYAMRRRIEALEEQIKAASSEVIK